MDEKIKDYFNDLESDDREKQYEAYKNILAAAEKEVDWAYEVWDQLVEDLTHMDNHRRSRAAQFLSYLAVSDPEKRVLHDFPAIWGVTKDKKFVTARHSLQAVWRIGLAGEQQKELVVDHLVNRYRECEGEKNYTLIRFDITQGLRHLFDALHDEAIKITALELIAEETDDKYRKKYAALWKNTH
ncbi:hypothetical protein MM300_10515 [Evansella sp. LMS18]|uniref:hypothetical protein n=1 Tax=Evansella sp. LMS18 TaxID=2924033 RepID=UPI0020D03FA5|nr:hypothetical protein [Evansella sp. LMS18]UTR12668.1 hypothetical protein MM300_10515 [Evansella sp. LMS18]